MYVRHHLLQPGFCHLHCFTNFNDSGRVSTMRVINLDNQERSPRSFGSIKITTKSLKKQKSLTRLLISRRPSHPPEPITRPKTATSLSKPSVGLSIHSPPLPILPRTPQHAHSAAHGTAEIYTNPNTPGKERKRDFMVSGEEIQNLRTETAPKRMDSLPKAYNGPSISDVTIDTPQTPIPDAEAPILQRSPSSPLLPVRSSSLAVNSRARGTSVPSNTLQPIPINTTVPFRPSIATNNRLYKPSKGVFSFEAEFGPISEDDKCLPSLDLPWDSKYDNDQVRASVRSALTSSSSFHDASSTERSSVATGNTTFGSLTQDSQIPLSKHSSMTVDDAIDMYATGFVDDGDHSENPSMDWPLSEERRRSAKIAEAINEPIGFDPRPSSAAIISGKISASPTPTQSPTTMRDQYGFLKASHHIKNDEHDEWSNTYMPSQERRTQKWLSYMRELSLPTRTPLQFPPRSVKTQRFVRKGIPPRWRGDAWFFYAGGDDLLQKHPDQFSTLVLRSEWELSSNDKDMIERDLHRTFPDNVYFKPDISVQFPSIETPLLSSLRRVLQAFALYCPRIGYCQSLNFIAGLLLLFLPEEKAFWMLHIITTDYLPGTHDVSLEGANVDLWVLMIAFKESMPSLWPKIGHVDGKTSSRDAKLPPISLCTTSWFMSLFIGTLPIESVLRVWDILFYEGSRTLFRVALAIFKLGEPLIKAMSDPMEIFQIVQGLPRGMLDVGTLLDCAFRRGGISQEWVEKRRKQRKQWYARARAKAAVAGSSITPEGEDSARTSSPGARKSNSVWRRAGQRMGG